MKRLIVLIIILSIPIWLYSQYFEGGGGNDSPTAGWGIVETANAMRVDTSTGKVFTKSEGTLKTDKTQTDTMPGDVELANKLALKKASSDSIDSDGYVTQYDKSVLQTLILNAIHDSLIVIKNQIIDLYLALAGETPPSLTAYYVSTTGDDDAAGDYYHPWATWNYGLSQLSADDTLYIRGGTYYESSAVAQGSTNGSVGHMINVWNYPGETPILDCSGRTQTVIYKAGFELNNCDYWYLKGLHLTNLPQSDNGWICFGFLFYQVNNCVFENLVSYNNEGVGIELTTEAGEHTTNNLFRNCDAYSNYDPYTDPIGGDADGIQFTEISFREDSNTIIACRTWDNSDDGIDLWKNEGAVYMDSCWSFSNGYMNGDGNGFKLGRSDSTSNGDTTRYVYHCVSAINVNSGFDQNYCTGLIKLCNNTAYLNGYRGFIMRTPDIAFSLTNNLSYANVNSNYSEAGSTNDTYNSWNNPPNVTVTDADFVNLSLSQLEGTRQSNGNLPTITYLTIAAESDLINAGTDVGLDYEGAAPDLGFDERE